MRNLKTDIESIIANLRVLKGKIVTEAQYVKPDFEELYNNPLIEALPLTFNEADVIEQFVSYPHISDDERLKNSNVRYQIIYNRLKNFAQILPIHIEIANKLSTMIRRGYLARNPASPELLKRISFINKLKEGKDVNLSDIGVIDGTLSSTAEGFSLVGISGIGKSTAFERLLKMYPQIIYHKSYKGNPLIRTQIVWLKIDCPFDGSLKTLCMIFFKAVDDILGNTNYYKKFGNSRDSVSKMMLNMTHIAALHSLGVLVIDEIQHLMNKRHNEDEMLNFFVTLTNTIGVPTVLIGTFKARKIMERDFRQARRACGMGSIFWDRMDKDSDWDIFVETMWDYQWLKNSTPLTDELNTALYEYSQGITAIAVNLFIFAQIRALDAEEIITKGLLKTAYDKDLKFIHKMIDALRVGDYNALSQYEDISLKLDDIISNKSQPPELRGKIKQLAEIQKKILEQDKNKVLEQIATEIISMGIFDSKYYDSLIEIIGDVINLYGPNEDIATLKKEVIRKCLVESDKLDDEAKLKEQAKKEKSKKKTDYDSLEKEDLRKLYLKSEKNKVGIYEILYKNGYIKNPIDEFLTETVGF